MSGLPLSSDTTHAFSSGASRDRGERGVEVVAASAPAPVDPGGTLSEREVVSSAVGPKEGHQSTAVSVPRTSGSALASRSESVSFTARKCFGNTGEYATLEEPRCVEVARFPTAEAAQAYALRLNQWLDARPAPDVVSPFFNSVVRVEPSFEGLLGIFERMLRPESSYEPQVQA